MQRVCNTILYISYNIYFTYLYTWFLHSVRSIHVCPADDQDISIQIFVSEHWEVVIEIPFFLIPFNARSVERFARIRWKFPALWNSNIKGYFRITINFQFLQLNSDVSADFSVVFYECDVWNSFRKEIVAISSTSIILGRLRVKFTAKLRCERARL